MLDLLSGRLASFVYNIEKGQGERLIICIGFKVEKMEVLKLAFISTDQLSQLRLTLIAVTVKRALSLLLEKGFDSCLEGSEKEEGRIRILNLLITCLTNISQCKGECMLRIIQRHGAFSFTLVSRV
ncbi:hypothetical protein ACROYT_G003810 [Oculina patagonica]